MHELSIAQSVVRTVTELLPGRTVTCVTLRVGVVAGVVPQALEFAWDVAVFGTGLAGSRLDVVRVPMVVNCRACGVTTEVEDPVRLRCPACDATAVAVSGGRELELTAVEVTDEEDDGAAAGTDRPTERRECAG